MTWATPVMFVFIPILIAAAIFVLWKRKTKRATFRFSSLALIKKLPVSPKARLASLPTLIKILGFILIAVALARPQKATTRIKKNIEGIDILLVLDISDSMLIEDMKPENRLVASKETLKKFIEARASDRIGLVVFSGEAYTRVPLTLDYPLLLQNLSEVETSRNIKMGTAIGVALASGAGRLRESTAKSRVMIFMTDGENNSGTIDPETALELAKEYGIKIYSIGMGKDGQAQLPVYIDDGRGNRIKQYRPMHSAVNEKLLGKFAEETGGKFWRATTGKGLQEVFSEIDRLERTKIDINESVRYEELFSAYLMWGIFLLLFGFLLESAYFRRLA